MVKNRGSGSVDGNKSWMIIVGVGNNTGREEKKEEESGERFIIIIIIIIIKIPAATGGRGQGVICAKI